MARFLVFSADSPFSWESVLLTGEIDAVPADEREAFEAAMKTAWRPDVFRTTEPTRGVGGYRFLIREEIGIKHSGLPPGFEGDAGETGEE